MTRIALTASGDDDGRTPRQGFSVGHCHFPQGTPDCPTCVEVNGVEWAARRLAERAAAAQMRDARAAAARTAGVAATVRTRRGLGAAQAADDDAAGSGWRSGWYIDPAAERGWDDGWGDSA